MFAINDIKNKSNKITFIIPTINEASNIVRCIKSIKEIAHQIYVIDSNSNDDTRALASASGAIVINGDWKVFSEKINWAIDNIDFETEWVARIDADEYFEGDFWKEWQLRELKCSAYSIRRKFSFLGKILNYGGWGSLWDVRFWRVGSARMENKKIDEHIVVDGKVGRLNISVVDDSLSEISLTGDENYASKIAIWIAKHNKYSELEAIDWINHNPIGGNSEKKAIIKRYIKIYGYYRLPLLLRPFLFFAYRYIILGGFLDGRPGLAIHILHSFWYRFLVDVKIFESRINRQIEG